MSASFPEVPTQSKSRPSPSIYCLNKSNYHVVLSVSLNDPLGFWVPTSLKYIVLSLIYLVDSKQDVTNLEIIFCIQGIQGNGLQVEATIEVDSGNNVSEARNYTFDNGYVLLFQSNRDRVEGMRIEEGGIEGRAADGYCDDEDD